LQFASLFSEGQVDSQDSASYSGRETTYCFLHRSTVFDVEYALSQLNNMKGGLEQLAKSRVVKNKSIPVKNCIVPLFGIKLPYGITLQVMTGLKWLFHDYFRK
jgi:hypothetical protein